MSTSDTAERLSLLEDHGSLLLPSFLVHRSLFIYTRLFTWNCWLKIEWARATRLSVCRCSKNRIFFCWPLFVIHLSLFYGLF